MAAPRAVARASFGARNREFTAPQTRSKTHVFLVRPSCIMGRNACLPHRWILLALPGVLRVAAEHSHLDGPTHQRPVRLHEHDPEVLDEAEDVGIGVVWDGGMPKFR